MVELVFKAVALAMGVGVVALTIMDEVEPRNALGLLGVGVACLALVQLMHSGEDDRSVVSISDPRFVQNRAFSSRSSRYSVFAGGFCALLPRQEAF